jgi:hypothetical protein
MLSRSEMTDPDAVVQEEVAPPQPPRPSNRAQTQMDADEQYARQLAEHYGGSGSYAPRVSSRGNSRGDPRGNYLNEMKPNQTQEEEHSFLDDDLPIIKENLKKGFLETQNTVNGWLTNLKKKIDGVDEDDGPSSSQARYGASNAPYRSRRSGDGRQSGDYNRYDADPHVLGDDFGGIQLNDDGSKYGVSIQRERFSHV